MIDTTVPGAVCRPNFSAAGRKRRTLAAWVFAGITGAVLISVIAFHAPLWWRALVAIPAMMTAITGLQVRRNTCVAHARMGTIEHEDFSTTKAAEAELQASRRVAATIYRDGVLAGVVLGALAAGSSLLG